MNCTDILLITSPFTQLNTPYPSTASLKGFLKEHNIQSKQMDLGILTLLKIFSKEGLTEIFDWVFSRLDYSEDEYLYDFFAKKEEYITTIDPTIRFLQGIDTTFAPSICKGVLPKGNRFPDNENIEWLFGSNGDLDKAKYLATLYIENIGDFIKKYVDEEFGFSRYAENICSKTINFDPIYNKIGEQSIVTTHMLQILEENIQETKPRSIGFTLPFPGNLLSTLQCAQYIKQNYPQIEILLGGGYCSSELREIKDIRFFENIDYLVLDDGERPLLQILDRIKNSKDCSELVRTFVCENGQVKYYNNTEFKDFSHSEIGTPDYEGLSLNQYISVIEVANPMHRLWSDGKWNKLVLAHGCYWHKCSFCDVGLDYIARFNKSTASEMADRMENIASQTQQSGFHFADEAAPPQMLKELSLELIRRGLKFSWWGNIRFEKTFSKDLCRLLSHAGCIAISGGLEVASDRLLKLMQKGVDIEQVARVTQNLTQSGIMVHAYLMYGFPTETDQETIDSLEIVRQLFDNKLIHSGFWHRFAMTVHSPIGKNPERYGVKRIDISDGTFAQNDCLHEDPKGCDHNKYGYGLKKAIYNYMHGIGVEFDLQEWFDFKITKTIEPKNRISNALLNNNNISLNEKSQVIWLYSLPRVITQKKKKSKLEFILLHDSFTIDVPSLWLPWIMETLEKVQIKKRDTIILKEIKESFENIENFDLLICSKFWSKLRNEGLLLL